MDQLHETFSFIAVLKLLVHLSFFNSYSIQQLALCTNLRPPNRTFKARVCSLSPQSNLAVCSSAKGNSCDMKACYTRGNCKEFFAPALQNEHYSAPGPQFLWETIKNAGNFEYSNTACLSPLLFTSANILPVPTISYQQQGYSILSLCQCFSPLKRLLIFSMYLQQHDTVWLGYFITSCLSLSLSANDCRFQSTVLFIEHHHSADPVTKSAKQSLCPSYSGFEWNSQLMLNLMP